MREFAFLIDGTPEAVRFAEPLERVLRAAGHQVGFLNAAVPYPLPDLSGKVVVVALRLNTPVWRDIFLRREELGCRVFRLSRGIGNIITGHDFGAEFAYVPGPSSLRMNAGYDELMLAVGSLKLQYVRQTRVQPIESAVLIAGDAIPGSSSALWSLFPDEEWPAVALTQHPGSEEHVRAEYRALIGAKGFTAPRDTHPALPGCGAFLCYPSSAVVFEAMLHRKRIGLVPYVTDVRSLAGTPFPYMRSPEDVEVLTASGPPGEDVTALFVAEHVRSLDIDSAGIIAEHMLGML